MLDILPGIKSTTGAMNAQPLCMENAGQNIANPKASRRRARQPYQRHQVVFETLFQQASEVGVQPQTVTVTRVQKDQRPPKLVYEPGHPDANSDGMVALPDINMAEEMVDLIASSRAFEANLAVVKNARSM